MSRIAYVNGRYVPQPDAAVNIEDRGYQFGDGIYEVVHLYDGRFIDEDLHLARLERSLREIALPMPMPRASLRLVLREVARRNRVTEGLLYMQVTRLRWGAAAITLPDLRWARCDIKTVNLLPNCLARQAAREKGAIEAVLFDEATGMVTEGAATSFWIVDEAGTIRTRPLSDAILPGCTRAALMAELQEAGIAFEERAFSMDELSRAREAFITSATSFVKPITKIDGAPVGDGEVGPVVRKLFDIFARHVKGAMRNAA